MPIVRDDVTAVPTTTVPMTPVPTSSVSISSEQQVAQPRVSSSPTKVAPVHGNIMIVISGPEHGRPGEVLRNVLSLF